MNRWPKLGGFAVAALVLGVSGALAVVSRQQAHHLVTNPPEVRNRVDELPDAYGITGYESLTLTSADGAEIAAWYMPSQNGAAIIMQHGYKANREEMLDEAAMMIRHGYGVIAVDLRAHGESDGQAISFGMYELQDVDAAYRYLLARPDVDPERIGMLGNSMGASIAILYAAQNPQIKAVVSVSAFASLQDEIATGVRHFTGLPPFPFAPMIQYFAEQETGLRASQIAAIDHIGEISPRPVFILQGGADTAIPVDSGQRLYDAAGEPRELWYAPQTGHVAFARDFPAEYEQRVAAFFDQYLLGE